MHMKGAVNKQQQEVTTEQHLKNGRCLVRHIQHWRGTRHGCLGHVMERKLLELMLPFRALTGTEGVGTHNEPQARPFTCAGQEKASKKRSKSSQSFSHTRRRAGLRPRHGSNKATTKRRGTSREERHPSSLHHDQAV